MVPRSACGATEERRCGEGVGAARGGPEESQESAEGNPPGRKPPPEDIPVEIYGPWEDLRTPLMSVFS